MSDPRSFEKITLKIYIFIENSDSNHLIEILDALGGFPILKGKVWNFQNFRWTRMVEKFHHLGFDSNYLMELKVIPSEKDYDSYGGTFILQLGGVNTILTKEKLDHIRNKEEVERYKMYMLRVIKKLNSVSDFDTTLKEINQIVDFESKLVRLVHCFLSIQAL